MGYFEKGRWITIDPGLKKFCEEDLQIIESLLPHLKEDSFRYNLLIDRKRWIIERLGNPGYLNEVEYVDAE